MAAWKERLHLIIDEAFRRQVAGAISLWVGNSEEAFLTIHQGKSAPHLPSDDQTIYDLASLTKILGTTCALAHACSRGLIDLKEEPFLCWPGVSVKNLLAHDSGLKAHHQFYLSPGVRDGHFNTNKALMLEALWSLKPKTRPGTSRLYSDLNFIALGYLLEKRYQKDLLDIFELVWGHSGVRTPLSAFRSGSSVQDKKIASTGFCPTRNRKLRGQVHDLNGYFMGGLAGHAGLFGALPMLSAFGQFFLRCYKDPRNAYEALIKNFAHKGLGFDRPSPAGSLRSWSPPSFGHFGFTGTSLFIDPLANDGRGLIAVLLSNRVLMSAKPEPIFWLREQVHRALSY